MVCLNCCGIAVVFAVAMIYMCVLAPLFLEENKYSLIRKLKDTLTVEQQNKFDRIKRERMSIHMRGYGYGLMASGLVLLYKYKTKSKLLTSTVMLCLTASITFVVNYFYYILSPKTEWMVTSLVTEGQKKAWLKMYRHMQFNYHVGFLLGIAAAGFLFKGLSM